MRVVERVIALLETLGEQSGGVGVMQLAEQLNLPASTLHRLLGVLAGHGFVVQDPLTRRYRLGPGVLRLARTYLQENTLVSVAQPTLARLRSTVQETVFATALLGDDAVCVATAESPRPLQYFMRVGQRMPYHAAASARAILAFRPEAEWQRLLDREVLRVFTASTQTDLDDVRHELRQVRERGFAVCEEEMEVGVTALAAPVRDAAGDAVASVTIVGPADRLSEAVQARLVHPLVEAADEISAGLGYDPRRAASTATATAARRPRALRPAMTKA